VDVLTDIAAITAQIGPDWTVRDGVIIRVVERGDFAGALAYVNEVGNVAEAINHHPDVDIRWGTVTLYCATHVAGGITDYDIRLTKLIDALDTAGTA
jgi:4a-hydroxytetrahydrobiopterin dehydratase